MFANAKRVLWIDDNPNFLLAVRAFFRGHPHIELVTAESAGCGLRTLKEQTFEMVISDLDLPDMGCRDLLRGIRSHFPGLIFGIVSGKEDAECLSDLSEGLVFVRKKPIDLEEMEGLILTS